MTGNDKLVDNENSLMQGSAVPLLRGHIFCNIKMAS